ncbi:DNA-binding protein [Ignavigranum ruoffiae]|uniref:DNA-binding protein n=1 Tax=Ignavigranum ruoffiae TaxID=89093 RepID=UPI0023574F63|nr:DNA-binding protein [Ignavigranum ruoffiae]
MEELQIKLSDDQLLKLSQLIANEINTEIKPELPLLNKKQLCALFQISNNTLDKWLKLGAPVIKTGRIMRFSVNEVNNWLKDR